jgi:hypothetical protein
MSELTESLRHMADDSMGMEPGDRQVLSDAANRIEVLEAQIGHPCLHLLGLERTGWQRYIFGRWVYNSEPFRRDIQRSLAAQEAGE